MRLGSSCVLTFILLLHLSSGVVVAQFRRRRLLYHGGNHTSSSSSSCAPPPSPSTTSGWLSLHAEALQLDSEALSAAARLTALAASLRAPLRRHVRQKNLGWQSAAAATTVGRILDEYSTSQDRADAGTADTVNGYYRTVINNVGLSILQGGYAASVLFNVEDLDKVTGCGAGNVRHVLRKHSRLFDLEELYLKVGELDFAEIHPKVLSLEAEELGEELKEGLSCMGRRSDFEPGGALNQVVDALVLALATRLEITEQLITFQ